MSFRTNVYHIMMIAIFAISFTGCGGGGKNKAEDAKVSVNPPKPIVITADATIDTDKTISGPWFSFSLSMTNNTTQKITIVALEVEVFAQGSSGMTETATTAFTPGQGNFTVGENLECKFTTFGTWNVGETKALTLNNGVSDCGSRIPQFYVGDNATGPSGKNYRYRVRAKPLGWFGTADAATDRFDKTFTFFTQ